MHDCNVATGDGWIKSNLGAYAAWAKTHNSLLVITYDEDDKHSGNQIPTVLYGQPVKAWQRAHHQVQPLRHAPYPGGPRGDRKARR